LRENVIREGATTEAQARIGFLSAYRGTEAPLFHQRRIRPREKCAGSGRDRFVCGLLVKMPSRGD
jgi:hypothetical protein